MQKKKTNFTSPFKLTFSLIIVCTLQARQKFLNSSPTTSTLFNSTLQAPFLPDLPLQAKAMHAYHKRGDENSLI